jgi:hypothetical protein
MIARIALRNLLDPYAGYAGVSKEWGLPRLHCPPPGSLEAMVLRAVLEHNATSEDLAAALEDCRDRILDSGWPDGRESWVTLPNTTGAPHLPRAPGRAAPSGGVAGWILPMGPDPIDPSMQVFVSPRRGAASASDARGKALLVDVWRRLASAPPVAGRTIDHIWMELSAHEGDWYGGVVSYHPLARALCWHGTATNARWAVLAESGGKVVLAWDSGTGRPSSYIGHCFAEAGAAVRAEDVPPPPLSLDELRAMAAR